MCGTAQEAALAQGTAVQHGADAGSSHPCSESREKAEREMAAILWVENVRTQYFSY